jgi:uncharacterized membrane protein
LKSAPRERCEKNAAEEGSVAVAETIEEDSTNKASTPLPPRIISCGVSSAFAEVADMIERRREGEGPMFIRVRDSHFRSILKAVSWRVTGSIDTFVLSFIFTGSVKVAGSIAGAEAITKMILYYLHERAWSVIRWDQQGQTGGGSP